MIVIKSVIPFKKEIKFDNKIAEICSISLEHSFNSIKGEVNGEFVINGDYKTHEISINRDCFNYSLPFRVEIPDNIDIDTVKMSIYDFTYEILDDSLLSVYIEFCIEADELLEEVSSYDRIFESVPEFIDESIILNKEDEIIEEKVEDKKLEIVKEDVVDTELITNGDDVYTKYHIHIIKEDETMELISSKYKVCIDTINKYNDSTKFMVGSTLIIPSIDE